MQEQAAYVLLTPAQVMKCNAIHSINSICLKSITFRIVVNCELLVLKKKKKSFFHFRLAFDFLCIKQQTQPAAICTSHIATKCFQI